MRERPRNLTDAQVLEAARAAWDHDIDHVEHRPVGFGAWHWQARSRGDPVLFLTLDPSSSHDAEALESAYRGAAALAEHHEVVHAPLVSSTGRFTVPLGDDRLSCTPWVEGAVPDRFGAEAAEAVRRLHRMRPPEGLPVWQPRVEPGLVTRLHEWTAERWSEGPLGERARHLVRDHLGPLEDALAVHQELAERLDPTRYVVTHGEPGVHNQWRARDGRLLLLDWESLALAPRERDLLGGVHAWIDGETEMLRFFELEWSLAEVHVYAAWLRGPHRENADMLLALEGLGEEIGAAAAPR